jgi:hypothetical protein
VTATIEGDSIRLTPKILTGPNRPADCNIFLIDRNSGRGFYTYYYQSVGLAAFQIILRRHYYTLKDSLITAASLKYAANGEIKEKHHNRARREYKGMLSVIQRLRSESLDTILEDLSELDAFEFHYERLLPNTKAFNPLRRRVKSEKIRVTFKEAVSATARRRSIVSAVRDAGLIKGAVRGVDTQGASRSIRIEKNPDIHEEWDFDQFADELDFKVEELAQSEPLKRLLTIAARSSTALEVS